MTKFADPQPPYCASCFNKPEGPCVDFEAAYDGPVIPGAIPAPVDDLVICEDCLKEAFAVLDPQNLKETIAELSQIVLDLEQEIKAKDKALRGFQFTTTELIEHPVAAFKGKPRLEGVPPEIRKRITQGLYERRGTSPAAKKPRTKKVTA